MSVFCVFAREPQNACRPFLFGIAQPFRRDEEWMTKIGSNVKSSFAKKTPSCSCVGGRKRCSATKGDATATSSNVSKMVELVDNKLIAMDMPCEPDSLDSFFRS